MSYELISSEEFDSLPEDDEQCFVEFEGICRRNMNRMINEDSNGNFDRSIQAQYIAAISAVAVECGLDHLAVDPTSGSEHEFYDIFTRFSLAVQGEVARIRIRGRRARGALSVQLLENTRTKIQHYVSRLRDIIDASDLPANRKTALHDKLNELVVALEERRLNLGKVMITLSLVMAGLASAATIAADGPAAITNIMRLIGIDKQSEDAAMSRLAPTSEGSTGSGPEASGGSMGETTSGGDLDDEIPF